jgi:2-polyprenyl-3-methyl-5-hydroxy-6-metoxy-1,4-benzoquinol methylase
MLTINDSVLDKSAWLYRTGIVEPTILEIATEWNNNVSVRAMELESALDSTYMNVLVPAFERALDHLDLPAAKVLDIGCGLGYLTNIIQQRGYSVIGIDVAEKAIEYAKRKFPNVIFEDKSILEFSKENTVKFDICVLNMVLHNLVNIQENLAAIHTLLNVNGYVIASVPNPEFWFHKHVKDKSLEFESGSASVYKLPFRIRRGKPHPSLITYIHRPTTTYKTLIRSAGFKILASDSPLLPTGQKDDDLLFCIWKKKE